VPLHDSDKLSFSLMGVRVWAILRLELGDMFRGILDGRNAAPADGVREALGRPAGDFAAYATRAAAAGSWD
jgi:hypothetical protein